ncbi:MAG: fumarylacetoacetate hydrolase family protein [Bacteroidetes bacterium]|nr:fumarylacetoacetate hydrolase family protein [Bacteroidota bacterium]
MKIICIGRNYADHAKEMNASVPTEPVFFMKPDTALKRGREFFYPSFTKDLHYECEVVVRICKVGKNIQEEFAANYYKEFSLGIDFTARDLQQKCKEKGMPWEIAKSWEGSAPISDIWLDKNDFNLNSLNFSLELNNKEVQSANTSDMIFNINQIIVYLSKFNTLKIGDLIYTGTPAGVGAVALGDILIGRIEGQEMFQVKIS